MFRRALPVWVLLSLVAGSSARAQMPFPRHLIPGRGPLERLGLERHWYAVVPLVETERLLRITRSQELLFAQTSSAQLHTYDAETGRLLWTAHLGEHTGFARGVAANSWAVFATNANMLYALDRGSGRPIWRHNLGTYPMSTPACDESRILVGMTNGLISAFSLKSVDDKGNEHIRDRAFPLWSYHAGGPIRTRPLTAEGLITFGGGDNKVWVVMADEPTVVFRIATGGPIGEGLAGYETRTLLAPSGDKVLYAFDLFTARRLWMFASGAPIAQEPIVANQDVYIINTAGDLSSIDPKTGEPRWTASTQGGRLAAVSPTKVYLRSYNLDLFIVDRATGRLVSDPSETHLRTGLNLRDYDLDIVNRFNDRIYFATRSGMVLAMRESGLPQPVLLRNPKELPFGYVPPEGIKETLPTAPATTPEAGQEPAADANAPAPAADKVPAPKKEDEKEPE